ncbi:O-antigen ligase family protein [Bacteroides sp. 224]|uniref:O-antigen ligase family protein n=1 Tax=Bacteroides sp. 224 TaxID=2302936 RepID=UPI0013D38166|nr:O-antigen ligase family protein [Bacteroides sp. 224]NDV64582.1 hypothetical protein [Bacteroides sp. 224]
MNTPFTLHIHPLAFTLCGLTLCIYPLLESILPVISTPLQITVLGLMCLLFMVAIPFNKLIKVTIPDIILFLYIIWIGIRILIRNEEPDPFYILSDIYLAFIYIAVRNMNKKQTNRIINYLFLSGVLQALICLAQLTGVIASNHSLFDFTGSFHNPGPLAGFLVPIFFLSGYLFYKQFVGKRKMHLMVVYGGGLLLFLGVLFLSNSRAAWLAVVVGVLLLLLKKGVSGKIRMASILLVLCLLVFLYYLRRDSADGRILIWKASLEMCKEAPVTGLGAHSFPRHYMHYQADYLKNHSDVREILLAGNVKYAFNELIRITAEDGLIGLLLFLSFCGIILRPVFRSYSNLGTDIISCAFIGLLIFGLFSYPSDVQAIRLVFIILGGILVNRVGVKVAYTSDKPLFIKGVILVVAIIGIGFQLNKLFMYEKGRREMRSFLLKEKDFDEDVFQRTTKAFNLNADYMLFYSAILFNQKEYHKALPLLEQAARLQPSSFLLSDLGECYYHTGDYVKAEQAFLLATEMAPGYVNPHYRLFSFYRQMNFLDKATQKAHYIINAKYKQYGSIAIFAKKEAKEFLNSLQ